MEYGETGETVIKLWRDIKWKPLGPFCASSPRAYDPDPGDQHSLIAGFQCQDDRFVVRSAHVWGNYWGIVGDS
jgi:hypothetical protein